MAAATALSQVSVTGICDPDESVPAEAGALLSHTTFGAAAVLGDGDGGLLVGGAGDAEGLAEGGAESDGTGVLAAGAETDGNGVAHPAAMASSTASAPLARRRAPVCPLIAFRLSLKASPSIAPEIVAIKDVFARRNVPRRAGRHSLLNATHGEDGTLAAAYPSTWLTGGCCIVTTGVGPDRPRGCPSVGEPTAVVFVRRRLGVFSPSDGGGGLRWTAPVCPVERPRRLSSPSRGGGVMSAAVACVPIVVSPRRVAKPAA